MRQPLLLNTTKLCIGVFLTPLIIMGCYQIKNDNVISAPETGSSVELDVTTEPVLVVDEAEAADSQRVSATGKNASDVDLEGLPEDIDLATYELLKDLKLVWGAGKTQSQSNGAKK